MKLLLIAHAAATLFMVGLIWFVQIVHYPLFSAVDPDDFATYEVAHARLTTRVVLPPMFLELGLAGALLFVSLPGVPRWTVWAGAVLVGLIWLSTFLLQVPMHEVLAQGFDREAHDRLVGTNWIRTAAWSARGLLACWMLWTFTATS